MTSRFSRRRRIALAGLGFLAAVSSAEAISIQELDRTLQRLQSGEEFQFFPGAQARIGVFTYEDPDGTEVGNAVSFLISSEILFTTAATSIGIVNFSEGAGSRDSRGLIYFDKVEALTQNQNFLLSLWGHLSRLGEQVAIDTFAQLASNAERDRFGRSIPLPEAMGGGKLRVRLRPDRLKLQGLAMSAEDAKQLMQTARDAASLRNEPSVSDPPTAEMVPGRFYGIIDSRDGWVRLLDDQGNEGWTSVSAFCEGTCSELLKNAHFANLVMAALDGVPYSLPLEGLTPDAFAALDQARAMSLLDHAPEKAADIARNWIEGAISLPDRGGSPGGAGFANLSAVARLGEALKAAGGRQSFDDIRLDKGLVREIASDLARASVSDPGNLEVLDNLALLFGYLGDEKRRDLALRIAASIRAGERGKL